MTLLQHFEKTMLESINMALATSVNNEPNVRVVTFAYDTNKVGRLFFSTFKGNNKISEFEKNPQVACVILPQEPEAEVQVRIFGRVKKSDMQLNELISMISKKYPESADTISGGGDMMEIYEICFEKAFVTVGITEAKSITF